MSLELSRMRVAELESKKNHFINKHSACTKEISLDSFKAMDEITNEKLLQVTAKFTRDLAVLDLSREESYQLDFMQKRDINADLKRNLSSKLSQLDAVTDNAIKQNIKSRLALNNS